MSVSILLLYLTLLALALALVATRRLAPRVALPEGQTAALTTGMPTAFRPPGTTAVRRACRVWSTATVDSLTDAETLLDRLEAVGAEERELVVLGQSLFTVRWR